MQAGVRTSSLGYAAFPTPIGTCAAAWNERGLALLQLPEATPEATVRVLLSRLGARTSAASVRLEEATPPAWVRDAMDRIARHLAGDPQDFSDLPLDLDGLPRFRRKVYEVARALPSGTTTSYGELAAAAGSPGGARAVGQSMANNPLPIVIPCHRVLAAGNAIGGFSAPGGLDTKRRLLEIERRGRC